MMETQFDENKEKDISEREYVKKLHRELSGEQRKKITQLASVIQESEPALKMCLCQLTE